MRAIAVVPKSQELRLLEIPEPAIASPTQVRMRMLEVGVCGTDREICTFAYGTPPPGCDHLVLGHEALGEVLEVGSAVRGLRVGDLVVPSVRRPCAHASCLACRAGRQDFCFTGEFTERGIKARHGFMTESFVEDEAYLYRVPAELRDVAVLVEPLTIGEKGLAQAWQVQRRLPWGAEPRRADPMRRERSRAEPHRTAVVLGAGPVGILGAMLLLEHGFSTFVYSRSRSPHPKAELVEATGARYISCLQTPPHELARHTGPIDLVYEAVGVASITFEVLKALGPNGVFVFTGIPPELPAIPVEADSLMRRVVLMNQAIVGTVNADRPAFEAAISDLARFKARWPEAMGALVRRFPLERYRELLLEPATGIKNVLRFG